MDIFWIILSIILGLGMLAIVTTSICCFIMGGNCSKYEDAAYYAFLAQKHETDHAKNNNDINTIQKGTENNGSCNDRK